MNNLEKLPICPAADNIKCQKICMGFEVHHCPQPCPNTCRFLDLETSVCHAEHMANFLTKISQSSKAKQDFPDNFPPSLLQAIEDYLRAQTDLLRRRKSHRVRHG